MISVIVPVYNNARFLPQCVDSLLNQSLPPTQIILVDDGSTDGSGEICDRYGTGSSIISVLHTDNQGVSAARNVGINAATGEYIMFVDSDDALMPDCLKLCSEALGNPNVSAVACDFAYGEEVPDIAKKSSRRRKTQLYTPRQAIIDTLYQKRLNCSCCGKLFRKSDLIRGGLFRPGLRFEDLEAFNRFYTATSGMVALVRLPLYFYRTNPDGYMHTITDQRFDVLAVTRMIEQRFSDDPQIRRAAVDRRFSANYNSLLLAIKDNRAEVSADCWRYICSQRLSELFNRHVRAKNKLGAAVSYMGFGLFKWFFTKIKPNDKA